MRHMSRRLAPAIGIVLSLAVTGCATITRGSTQALTIDSAPLGATASLSNGERCTTPCTLKLKRKHPVAVEVCKAGYQPVLTQVLSQIAGAGAAGIELAGLAPDRGVDLLQHILGLGAFGQPAQAHAEQARGGVAIEPLERGAVAARDRAEQFGGGVVGGIGKGGLRGREFGHLRLEGARRLGARMRGF